MKKFTGLRLLTVLIVCSFGCQKVTVDVHDDPVYIPAGSVDALEQALRKSSTVILEPGLHTETKSVTVTGKCQISGKVGAVLRMQSAPATTYPLLCNPALHLKNATNTIVEGLVFEPVDSIGGTAILVEDSPNATVKRCEINRFQFGILVEKSSSTTVSGNKITVTDAWQTAVVPEAHGIVVINGESCLVENNEVAGAFFGIWACDKYGKCLNNRLHDNYLGIILCKVPLESFSLPGGALTGAVYSCERWTVQQNESHHNINVGYLIIDGANNNLVEQNTAEANGDYDYELAGDSNRFGFLTPFCFSNTVQAANGDSVKNCGQNNTVSGGILIDTNVNPCN